MKRTTTTTHHYDAEGKLIETVIVEHVEDESAPNVQPWVYPYTPYPGLPWTVTYGQAGQYSSGIQITNTGAFLHLVPPPDDDGTAGVPAVA